MVLTDDQKLTLKTAILAEPSLSSALAEGNDGAVADWLNADSTFKVWRTNTPVADIQDNITWSNFTPSNPDGTSTITTTNWLLACQGKQFNLQNLLNTGMSGSVSTGKANVRAGLQDALTSIPSGTLGASRSGGWANVQLVIQRFATNLEKNFATGTGTSAAPGNLVIEGNVRVDEIPSILGR